METTEQDLTSTGNPITDHVLSFAFVSEARMHLRKVHGVVILHGDAFLRDLDTLHVEAHMRPDAR